MTLKEINEEIAKLQALKRQMEDIDVEENKKLARQFVGKCYRVHGTYFIKILGIPRTQLTLHGRHYNEYQYPVLILNYPEKLRDTYIGDDDFYPCHYEDLHFDLWRGDKSKCAIDYHEITEEEFELEFNKCIKHFKKQIDEMVKQYE